MDAASIRRLFVDYFVGQGHLEVPGASLVDPGDPTLLFTSAGMVQFKPYFLGQAQPPRARLTSVQKCFRTTDIDVIGDASHLTFFEMMGNFSFGDYFKKEVQAWAWDLITRTAGIPAERLVATVFTDDHEAFATWRALGLPVSRIFRYGEVEGNYWFAGEDGPCGPCSELHYDMRPDPSGAHPGPAADADRYLEVWNLVFMQFQRHLDGHKTPLPAQNIDTGAGLERWAIMLQDKASVYETDIFAPLLDYVAGRSDRDFGRASDAERRALRVIVEHGRAMTFLVSDGVLPSNDGRGYVLRRLIRRALYMAQTLGIEEPLLADVAGRVRTQMGSVYSEINDQASLTDRVLVQEEERFRRTLATGHQLLEERYLPQYGQAKDAAFPGDVAFLLYDTYGFPPDLTREVAAQAGLAFDQAGFDRAMTEQRERGRASAEFRLGERSETYASLSAKSAFVGYGSTQDQAVVVALVVGDASVERAETGAAIDVVLDRTPFYPEGGGQMGDAGRLVGTHGEVAVHDTQPHGDLIVHHGEVVRGGVAVGDGVEALVKTTRRHDSMRNHTATHLLHAALRQVLGDHVRQAGSLVAPERLRFDYTQAGAQTPEQMQAVQLLVSAKIRADLRVGANEMAYADALKSGAMAIFGEKYGTAVRVVEICDPDPSVHDCFSKELCGGTHAPSTGFIGGFQIVSNGSVGAGVRRIEALTGGAAEMWQRERMALLEQTARLLKTPPADVPQRVQALQEELEALRCQVAQIERAAGSSSAAAVADKAQEIDGVQVAVGRVEVASVDALRQAGDEVRKRLKEGVVVLGAVAGDRSQFIAMITPDTVARGLHAGNLIKEVAKIAGGGGGGRPEMAQAGGKDAEKLDAALAAVPDFVRMQLAAAK